MTTKLNQVIAIEKGVKTRVNRELGDIYHRAQKEGPFQGFSKVYVPKDDDGEAAPPSAQRVQEKAERMLTRVAEILEELIDVTAQKDFANTDAVADIEIDGGIIISAVPATHLLFLDKQLTDMHTFISKLPTLDPAEEWTRDETREMYVTEPVRTARTKKTQRGLVLHPPTKEHPAQTQLITEDVYVGDWLLTKHSGALAEARKRDLLRRVEAVQRAVKFAREKANTTQAPPCPVASQILSYIIDD